MICLKDVFKDKNKYLFDLSYKNILFLDKNSCEISINLYDLLNFSIVDDDDVFIKIENFKNLLKDILYYKLKVYIAINKIEITVSDFQEYLDSINLENLYDVEELDVNFYFIQNDNLDSYLKNIYFEKEQYYISEIEYAYNRDLNIFYLIRMNISFSNEFLNVIEYNKIEKSLTDIVLNLKEETGLKVYHDIVFKDRFLYLNISFKYIPFKNMEISSDEDGFIFNDHNIGYIDKLVKSYFRDKYKFTVNLSTRNNGMEERDIIYGFRLRISLLKKK